jgi:predicted KAP-like P-loop ATPase
MEHFNAFPVGTPEKVVELLNLTKQYLQNTIADIQNIDCGGMLTVIKSFHSLLHMAQIDKFLELLHQFFIICIKLLDYQ